MLNCLLAAICAFALVFLVTFQTRQIADKSTEASQFWCAVTLNLIWGYAVRQVVLNAYTIPFYALGAGLGTIVSRRVWKWWKDRA